MTLVKVKGHMTLVRYCGLDTSIKLSHNPFVNFAELRSDFFITLTFMALVKVKGHMTLVRYCGLDTSIRLSHNPLDIYSYILSAADNAKFSFL